MPFFRSWWSDETESIIVLLVKTAKDVEFLNAKRYSYVRGDRDETGMHIKRGGEEEEEEEEEENEMWRVRD